MDYLHILTQQKSYDIVLLQEVLDLDRVEHAKKLLNEEVAEIIRLTEEYQKEINGLPRGSVSAHIINADKYYYHSYFSSALKKKVSEYLGKDKDVAQALKEKIKRRRHLERLIRDYNKDLEIIKKMLKLSDKCQRETQKESVIGNLREAKAVAVKNENVQGQIPVSESKTTPTTTKNISNPDPR